MKYAYLLLAFPLLAACERSSDVPTAEENRQLDNAADLLDRAPRNLESVDDRALNIAEESEANQL